MNHVPYPETSEELRLLLIKVLEVSLIKYTNDFLPVISDFCAMISKLLNDSFPEIKTRLSDLVILLCQKLSKNIGVYSKNIITSLCLNLKHSHNKIRKITIIALGDVLLCENAGKNFEECNIFFKIIANDKNYDVRKAFFAVIYKLITNLNITHLEKFEYYLVIYLMTGLSDEKEDIQKICFDHLEQAGQYKKKLNDEINSMHIEN